MSAHIWVVEMLWSGKWIPTVGVALTRIEGRRELYNWRLDNPGGKFRLARYAQAEARRAK